MNPKLISVNAKVKTPDSRFHARELGRIVEFASAAASINCRTLGGRSGLPSRSEVEGFIKERRE